MGCLPLFLETPKWSCFMILQQYLEKPTHSSPRGHFSTGLPEVITGVVKCTSRKTASLDPKIQPFTSFFRRLKGSDFVILGMYQFHIPKGWSLRLIFPCQKKRFFSFHGWKKGVSKRHWCRLFGIVHAAQHFSRHLLFDHIIEVQDILLLFLDTNPSSLQPSNPPTLHWRLIQLQGKPTSFTWFPGASVKVTKLMLSKHLQRCSWTASGFLPAKR